MDWVAHVCLGIHDSNIGLVVLHGRCDSWGGLGRDAFWGVIMGGQRWRVGGEKKRQRESLAGHGMAWRGKARQSLAWQGLAWHDMTCWVFSTTCRSSAWQRQSVMSGVTTFTKGLDKTGHGLGREGRPDVLGQTTGLTIPIGGRPKATLSPQRGGSRRMMGAAEHSAVPSRQTVQKASTGASPGTGTSTGTNTWYIGMLPGT